MWVIFEGLDKVGKGTLENALLKHTKYEHIIIDRGPVGYLAFDKIYNRGTSSREHVFKKEIDLVNNSNQFLVFYVHANPEIALSRIKNHNESCDYNYKEAQDIYNSLLNMYNKNIVVDIDTSNITIEEAASIVINTINNRKVNDEN